MERKKNEGKRIGEGKAGPGRPKGVPNKITMDVRDAILNAFETVGGVSYLVRVAHDDPKTFCALLAKILPREVKVEAGTIGELMSAVSARVKQKSDGESDE